MKFHAARLFATGIVLLSLGACAPFTQYRTDYSVCELSEATSCPQSAAWKDSTREYKQEYWLNFVEFDDEGLLWDRQQMHKTIERLQGAQEDLLMVVFVHGWKHNAADGDDNIKTFRRVLSKLADSEAYLATDKKPARRVAGVYLGWRGASVPLPGAENLTFWSRKSTAHRVGGVGVSEVLSRLEDVQRTKNRPVEGGEGRSRLAVVGHSFGGAVVYAALANILQNRFVATDGPAGESGRVVGFGNLVVLINPAFEATLYAPLSDMSTERAWYPPHQLPTLAILTSEHDRATDYAFPAGRWFSTLFDYERTIKRWNPVTKQEESINSGQANRSAVGHFEPYRTHSLAPVTRERRVDLKKKDREDSAKIFKQASAAWREDLPGSKIFFGDLVLERTTDSAARNPCLVIQVDGDLIEDHNDIDDERMIEFLKQMISISAQNPKATVPETKP